MQNINIKCPCLVVNFEQFYIYLLFPLNIDYLAIYSYMTPSFISSFLTQNVSLFR